jgi:Soluble lytic murein transglycosylase and related regulatory proteins (some contain LysM/invasin domains)
MVSVNHVSNIENKNQVYKKQNTSKSSGASFESFLGESSSMDKIFDEAAAKYNVPVDLLKAVAKAESDFNPKAVSSCGAQGVMQLMPATAKGLGVTDAFDPEQNIMGGAKYISSMLKRYDGNTKLALAAYNAGSGNVKKYGGIPPFKETQNYVKKIMGYLGGPELNVTDYAKVNTNTDRSVTDNSSTSLYSTMTDPSNISLEINDSASGVDNIFTYDDYLNFLDKYLQAQKEKEQQNQEEENTNILASKQLNYNIPVMNLINSL